MKVLLNFQLERKDILKLILINFFFIFSNVLVINLGVNVLIGFTDVSRFLGGPLILKLTPNTPHLF